MKSRRLRLAMLYAWGRSEMRAKFLWETLQEGDPFGRPRLKWEDNIKITLICLRIGTRGRQLWAR
jgi:hypothetical protein